MSRSVTHTPITSNANVRAGEEKAHKQRTNRAARRAVHTTLQMIANGTDPDETLVPERREIRKHGAYGPKDGKHYLHEPDPTRLRHALKR